MQLNKSLPYVLNVIHADEAFVRDYTNAPDQSTYFKSSRIKKRAGYRIIHEPVGDTLQNIYKNLYEELQAYRPLIHDVAHGFIAGRSNVTNASLHLGARRLLNLDLEDFFGSITTARVQATFLRLGMQKEVAETLAKLSTLNGILPQGVNGSPEISNHCLYELDVALQEYARKHHLMYSRYADDMSFSTSNDIQAGAIIAIIEKFGFKIAFRKIKFQKRGSNQYVTGLTVFDTVMPRIAKRYKRRLRLELYLIKKYGIEEFIIRKHSLVRPKNQDELPEWTTELNDMIDEQLGVLEGRIHYIHGVEPDRATEFYAILEEIYKARKRT